MDRDALIDNLRAWLAGRPGVVCAWLFGSRARGSERPDSDVDVALLLDHEPASTLADSAIAMAGELEAAVHLPVDVVVVNRAPVDLVHRIMRDGILIEERDRSARVRFEVATRNVVVQGYERPDLGIVRDVVEHRLDDLIAFSDAIRTGLARQA